MKNFKLLLASTAILSTGAIIANSADLTWSDYTNAGINIPLNVWVVDPIKVAVERGIDFGVTEYDDSDKTKTVIVDTEGNVTGTAQHFGGAHSGLVWYKITGGNEDVNMKLAFPTTPVQLYAYGNEEDNCGTVSGFTQTRGSKIVKGYGFDYPIYIGATYTSSDLSSSDGGGTSCEGSVTATLVYDNGETSSGD